MNNMVTGTQKNIDDLRAEIQEMVQTATQDVLNDVHTLLKGAQIQKD